MSAYDDDPLTKHIEERRKALTAPTPRDVPQTEAGRALLQRLGWFASEKGDALREGILAIEAEATRSEPSSGAGLDAAWAAAAEAALPPGAYLTTIIEAWSARGPEGRRIYHDGLLHRREGFAAALLALAARLAADPPADPPADPEVGK